MNIRKYRKSKNLTQLELASQLGVERTTVTMWENNYSKPSIDILKQLSIILQCSLDELVA